ncbi:hypothetical protein DQ04_00381130 [Trypanosoma grayi]|uniref:hypothetical protein n=1 Tax=Trypanosoma grayi TaxID=71804 RepID=UPI0004F45021|nr:hypothetical protein DQ04_00381130 [Trypanosoma grayi]KEG14608.1 hypothetical protein DQ04_00381130 [Trypanosoma grayi]
METSLLRRLRRRYASPEKCMHGSFVIDAEDTVWPRPLIPSVETPSSSNRCNNCCRLIADMRLLQEENAENTRAIDLLTVALRWEQVHGQRRGAVRWQHITSNATTNNKSDYKDSDNKYAAAAAATASVAEPSSLMVAYQSLQETHIHTEEELFHQRCRYEGQIADLEERLARAEHDLRNTTDLNALLIEELKSGARKVSSVSFI